MNFFLRKIGAGITSESSRDLSGLIAALGNGNQEALNRLMSFDYPNWGASPGNT